MHGTSKEQEMLRMRAQRGAGRSRLGGYWRAALGISLLPALLVGAASPAAAGRGADGHYEKRESSHFVLFQDVDIDQSAGLRGSRRFEQQVLETLERAYDLLDSRLGMRPGRPITVVIHDPAIFVAQFSGLFRFPAAGFYGGTIHIRGDTVVSEQLIRVLHHELVHAAFDAAAPSLILPAWFNEGVAEWFEARSVGKKWLTARERQALSGLTSSGGLVGLEGMSGPSLAGYGPRMAQIAYLESYGFFEFLVRRDGERRLRDLCRELLRTDDLERAFQRSYQADLSELQAEYRSDLRSAAH
jgi:hypothetical protein